MKNSAAMLNVICSNVNVIEYEAIGQLDSIIRVQYMKFYNSRINIVNSQIKNFQLNSSDQKVYLMHIFNNVQLTLTNVSFQDNVLVGNVGLLEIDGGSAVLSQFFANNSHFGGSVVYIHNNLKPNYINISSSVFSGRNMDPKISTFSLKIVYVAKLNIIETNFTSECQVYFSQLSKLFVDKIVYTGNGIQPIQDQQVISFTQWNLFMAVTNEVFISNSIFTSLSSIYGALLIQISSSSNTNTKTISITNSTFMSNKGYKTGALYIDIENYHADNITKIFIDSCQFINNQVFKSYSLSNTGKGGALLINYNSTFYSPFLINQSLFSGNNAEVQGGAISWSDYPPTIDSQTLNWFTNNSAVYGDNIASQPFRFYFASQNMSLPNVGYDWERNLNPSAEHIKNSSFATIDTIYPHIDTIKRIKLLDLPLNDTVDGLVSGPPNEINLIFYLLDIYGQVVSSDNETVLSMTCLQDFKFNENNERKDNQTKYKPYSNIANVVAINGMFNISNMILHFWPGGTLTAKYSLSYLPPLPTKFLVNASENLINATKNEAYLTFSLRNCTKGELFNLEEGTCYSCPNGSYTLVNQNNSIDLCSSCNTNQANCFGGNMLTPKQGHWRKDVFSNLLVSCPNPQACLGSSYHNYSPTGYCAEGYIGNLCSQCSDNNSVMINNTCINCGNDVLYYCKFFFAVFIQLLIIGYGVKYNKNSGKKLDLEIVSPHELENEKFKKLKFETILSDLIKIIINYFQFIAILAGFNFSWPKFITGLFLFNKILGGTCDEYFSIDCLMIETVKAYGTDATFIKFLIILLIPYMFACLVLVFWVLFYHYQKIKIKDNPKFSYHIITTLVISAFIFQPYMIKYSLLLFQCGELNKDEFYLTMNYDLQCFTENYYQWSLSLAIPTLIIWVIILPIIALLRLPREQNKMNDKSTKCRFLFLYRGYKSDRCFWEFIVLTRKILLIITLVFLYYISTNFQAFMVSIILSLSFVVQKLGNPYRHHHLNKLEEKSIFSLFIICLGGWYFEDQQGFKNNIVDWIIIILILFTNLGFLLNWSYHYLCYVLKISNILTKGTNCLKNIYSIYLRKKKSGANTKIENKSNNIEVITDDRRDIPHEGSLLGKLESLNQSK